MSRGETDRYGFDFCVKPCEREDGRCHRGARRGGCRVPGKSRPIDHIALAHSVRTEENIRPGQMWKFSAAIHLPSTYNKHSAPTFYIAFRTLFSHFPQVLHFHFLPSKVEPGCVKSSETQVDEPRPKDDIPLLFHRANPDFAINTTWQLLFADQGERNLPVAMQYSTRLFTRSATYCICKNKGSTTFILWF